LPTDAVIKRVKRSLDEPIIPFPLKKVARKTALAELEILAREYPDAVTELVFGSTFQLLIAVMLSAQTTDVMVNKVTPELFSRFPDAAALAQANIEEVDAIIARIGFHHTKARNAVSAAHLLVERHGGDVPQDRDALEALPGVGRKTASVVLSVAFADAAFAVDTHVFRVSRRLGFSLGRTPREIEEDVTRLVPREDWRHAHHWLILHGRRVCKAPIPKCGVCAVRSLCPSVALVEKAGRRS
jgi:endonuclease-3